MALARLIPGLSISMARQLNRLMKRKGSVFADRYHARPLRTPTEVRRALVSLLHNGRKHLVTIGVRPGPDWHDPYSSAMWFTGWQAAGAARHGPAPVASPVTWLLHDGYRRAGGPLRREETPKV